MGEGGGGGGGNGMSWSELDNCTQLDQNRQKKWNPKQTISPGHPDR